MTAELTYAWVALLSLSAVYSWTKGVDLEDLEESTEDI